MILLEHKAERVLLLLHKVRWKPYAQDVVQGRWEGFRHSTAVSLGPRRFTANSLRYDHRQGSPGISTQEMSTLFDDFSQRLLVDDCRGRRTTIGHFQRDLLSLCILLPSDGTSLHLAR